MFLRPQYDFDMLVLHSKSLREALGVLDEFSRSLLLTARIIGLLLLLVCAAALAQSTASTPVVALTGAAAAANPYGVAAVWEKADWVAPAMLESSPSCRRHSRT